ncbi:hypothetical protein HXX76_013012 [Chlamydomonas incerta]|uniref:Pherophorin domain-containing protein n=1 Tax=Chlamydomonas incerta TaxID=51695 RepID=A0A835VUS2_CHLIN|nr:hypothetical protein HXX76_013012 [Chlamydomonas incerta]|eukprot:KAG2426254.1 hypothetical protein HXX76_013012 [Chlamydomonas incerta]
MTILCLVATLQAGETGARPVALESSLDVPRRHAHEVPGSSAESGLTSAWAAFVAFVSGGRAASASTSPTSASTSARPEDGASCACSICVQITLRAAALSPEQQQLGGGGSARLGAGSCGRVQQLLVSDLTQAAAHLGIHVTQPFAPAACELESADRTAAAAQQQGAALAGAGSGRVVSAVSVCGRVQEGPAASSALTLHLQEAASRYYAAAELAEHDLYSCPPAMAGMSVSVDLIRRVVPLMDQPAAGAEGARAGAHAQQRNTRAAAAQQEGGGDDCVTTVHELSCMRRKTRKL